MEDSDPDPYKPARKIILVVEDDEGVGAFMVEALSSEAPYQALLATNAVEALAMVNTLRPDVCVLDYLLPGITGLELADRLHSLEIFQQLPIILMSAHAPNHAKEREDLLFLAKPFSLDELFAAVEHGLSKSGGRRQQQH
ncbi:MAG TPA: response regulator [Ktedonobacteraceae bacterium]|nr:response regulator [Ktedonobacteraceae bacterium]